MKTDDSSYWYSRTGIPQHVLSCLKEMTTGTETAILTIGGNRIGLLSVSGTVFRKAFSINREYLFRGDYTAPPEENDYDSSVNYLTEDGLAGFSITSSGWLVSLFSNYEYPGFAHSVKKIITEKASKLVCITASSCHENKLVELYKQCFGFRIYAKTKNDSQIMAQCYGTDFVRDFQQKRGTPFHIFMIGAKAKPTVIPCIKEFEDYFIAEDFVDRNVFA